MENKVPTAYLFVARKSWDVSDYENVWIFRRGQEKVQSTTLAQLLHHVQLHARFCTCRRENSLYAWWSEPRPRAKRPKSHKYANPTSMRCAGLWTNVWSAMVGPGRSWSKLASTKQVWRPKEHARMEWQRQRCKLQIQRNSRQSLLRSSRNRFDMSCALSCCKWLPILRRQKTSDSFLRAKLLRPVWQWCWHHVGGGEPMLQIRSLRMSRREEGPSRNTHGPQSTIIIYSKTTALMTLSVM